MDKTGKGLAEHAKSKLGTPYVYGAKGANGVLTQAFYDFLAANYKSVFTYSYITKIKKMKLVGKTCTDCSGLISWYTGKVIGSSQMYATAKKRLPIADIKNFAIGTVLWKNGHVGVYIGIENGVPFCIEAKGIDYGTVKTKVSATKWQCGLTFDYIDLTYEVKVPGTSKGKNPYQMPAVTIKKGQSGTGVKWLQWELVEAGFDLTIDGEFGPKTLKAVKDYQASCKLVVDGLVGTKTKNSLLIS